MPCDSAAPPPRQALAPRGPRWTRSPELGRARQSGKSGLPRPPAGPRVGYSPKPMAACLRCGAVSEEGAAACPTCGAPNPDNRETAALGSAGERPLATGTLVLGSGIPLDGPLPVAARSAPSRDVAEPIPAPRESQRPPRAAVEPRPRRRPRRDPAEVAAELDEAGKELRKRLRPRLDSTSASGAIAADGTARPIWRRTPVLLSAFALALLAAGSVALLVKRQPTLSGEPRFDAGGQPELQIACPKCADGTQLELGANSAIVKAGRAVLRLTPPLPLGRNRAAVTVHAPGQTSSRQEEVEYEVDFVVSADQAGLSHPEPTLALVADARPDVSLIVDGRVVPKNESGIRRYEIPVRAQLTGPAKGTQRLVRTIPYVVQRANGVSQRGELEFRVDIVPLSVDAPGESIVIETSSFVLAGVTERDGMVTVEGRPITVDPQGRFAQLMSVSAVGDTTISVRATAPGRAPRFFPIRVHRVASLTTEAVEFERRAQTSFAAIAGDLEQKRGWAVALEGKLTEVKSDGYRSSLLLEVTRGCTAPPCLARLEYGARVSFAVGAELTAYGYLTGKSPESSSGRELPQVRVEFLRGRP